MERAGRNMKRAGASQFPPASSSGGGASRIWVPSLWQLPGYSGPNDAGYSGISTGYERYWVVLQKFDVAGVITDLSLPTGNPSGPNAGGDKFADVTLYAVDPSNPLQPTDLIHNFRAGDGPAQGFGGVWNETGLAIAVAAGEVIAFSLIWTQAGDPCGGGVSQTDVSARALGSVWGGASGNPVTMVHAIKKASPGYGDAGAGAGVSMAATTPADPFPTLAAGTTDFLLHAQSGNVPAPFFKFRPS